MYRNNGAKPKAEELKIDQPKIDLTANEELETQPIPDLESDDDGMDIIERARAKRKREAALAEQESKAKRVKVELPTPIGESTVLVVINNYGHWDLRTDQFVCK